MQQNPSKEKIVNAQNDHDNGQQGTATSLHTEAPNKENNKKPLLTPTDLKGKKVDGDPSLETDQPIDQVN